MNVLQVLKSSINNIYAKYINNNENIEDVSIFYVAGSQTLPPPLEPEEEEQALQRLSNGDESVKQLLVERNLRLVVYIAKKFFLCTG